MMSGQLRTDSCFWVLQRIGEELLGDLVGWGTDQRGFGEDPGMKTQLLNLVRSIRTVMRIPLIGINVLVIGFKLVLG